jgi:hypothetical protein
MTTLNLNSSSSTLPSVFPAVPNALFEESHIPAARLIVLVPYLEADFVLMARRVWELANTSNMQILLLGLYGDPAQEPSLRRELVAMSAILNDIRLPVTTELVLGIDWGNVVKARAKPGDMVVCLAEQRAGLLQKPLSQILQSELDMPLYILSGLYPATEERANRLSSIFAWAGSAALIGVFFLLQIQVGHFTKDWAQVALFTLSISVECWMIWTWNNFFS